MSYTDKFTSSSGLPITVVFNGTYVFYIGDSEVFSISVEEFNQMSWDSMDKKKLPIAKDYVKHIQSKGYKHFSEDK